jgi:hypothetical protein
VALCGIKFFYERTLHRKWTILDLVRAPQEKKLPVVLTIEEVIRFWHVYTACVSRYASARSMPVGYELTKGFIYKSKTSMRSAK